MENKKEKKRVGTARRVIGDVLLVLIAGFTVYLSVIMIHRINTVVLANVYKNIFWRELVICGLFLLLALDIRFNLFTGFRARPLRIVGWVVRGCLIVAAAAVLFIGGRIIFSGMIGNAGDTDRVLVLGMALEDGQPTEDLRLRLKTAKEYAEEHPNAVLVLTGGNPDESGRTEAAVMKELLTEQGFPEERMVLEDKAFDTRTNFKNVAEMVDPAEPVAVVSSNYHMYRAAKTAESAGFTDVRRLPAPSDPLRYGVNVMWEIVSEVNSILNKRP